MVGDAAISALYILRVERYAATTSPAALNAMTMAVVAGCSILWAVSEMAMTASPVARSRQDTLTQIKVALHTRWAEVCFLGLVCTAFCSWLQNAGQSTVPAETASIIFAMVGTKCFFRISTNDLIAASAKFGRLKNRS